MKLTVGKDLSAYAAQKRWETETGGIQFFGMTIYTDDRSKMMLMGARVKAQSDPAFTTRWKTDVGFIDLDATTIVVISDAVLSHVDACFQKEAEVLAKIATVPRYSFPDIDADFATVGA